MTDEELQQLVVLMNRACGLMVATFDVEDDPFHVVQTITLSANPNRRIIIWIQPDAKLDRDWNAWEE